MKLLHFLQLRYLCLFVLIISYMTGARAQNSLEQRASGVRSPANNPFNLNKYVWSHTNYKTSSVDKPVMEFKDIEEHISIGPDADLSISPDGKYFAYSIQNTMLRKRDSIVVQCIRNSWRKGFATASPGFFSADSKQYIFQDKNDLCFLQVGNGDIHYMKGVASYQQPSGYNGEWLACQLNNKKATVIIKNFITGKEKRYDSVTQYGFDISGSWLASQLNNDSKELVIYNLATGKEQNFKSVVGYLFDTAGKVLVVQTMEKAGPGFKTTLQYISLADGTIQTIWQSADSTTSLSCYVVDGGGKQVAFMLQESSTTAQPINSIWYWKTGMNKAILKVNQQTEGIELGWQFQSPSFNESGRYITFFVQPFALKLPPTNPDAVKVDVWSYKDTILQSSQPYLAKMPPRKYRAVIATEGNQVIRLEKEEYESLRSLQGDFAVILKPGGNRADLLYGQRGFLGDRFWEEGYNSDSNWLVSLKDGTRRLLRIGGKPYGDIWFSPKGKYLVYFDGEQGCNFFTIELSTGKLANISVGIPSFRLGVENYYLRTSEKPKTGFGIAGWLEEDKGILVYDNYDIWQLDLAGKKPSMNITNGYGRKTKTKFSLTGHGEDGQNAAEFSGTPIFSKKTPFLLKAFNMMNKYNGVYRKVLGESGNPELLCSGPYTLEKVPTSTLDIQYTHSYGITATKATRANVWIVLRQSATQAPNYFLTTDFRIYRPLTDIQPQKAYNWITAELHSFKQLDGTLSQGVLYKPENFDPTKKYPVIIVFYSTLSDRVHLYPTPNLMVSPSAPKESPGWMASHGYLVFTPDIYFSKGKWGPSTMNTIEGAARYMSNLPFVDGNRLGACGHSNSGRTGYYVLTHSKVFAAMSVGAATTDIISASLSIDKSGTNKLEWTEVTAFGTGLGNLWQNKSSWLDQTSVLHTDKVTSPVLLFHNDKDGVQITQVIEMFIALRRLEKRSWWLNYNESGHIVKGKDGKDFTVRYTQFFDHYLKGAPPPRWMTQGIPNQYKLIESRFELDPQGSCGNDCKICKEKKYGDLR